MTDGLSVHGDPLWRKHSHAPVRAVRKCLYVEIGGKVVGRAHHRRWGAESGWQGRSGYGWRRVPTTHAEGGAEFTDIEPDSAGAHDARSVTFQ